mmetsp:Transcript_372/g.1425  ORF Transcript_372/g.1425 Transcript_372/m.1425 type:complete len:221 (+) Transcript_372:55-717(+)
MGGRGGGGMGGRAIGGYAGAGGLPIIPMGGGIPRCGIPGDIPCGIPCGIPGGIPGGKLPGIDGGMLAGGPIGMPGRAGLGANPLAATVCVGAIKRSEGPPTPRTWPPKPTGAAPLVAAAPFGTCIPLPAGLACPGPPGVSLSLSAGGGGPSTVRDTTFSPRTSTNPRTRRCSLSSTSLSSVLLRTRRYSSQSPSTRFMWRSKAMKVPTRLRLSASVTRIR